MDLELVSQGFNSDDTSKAWAEEMAWNHATILAQANGISMGSDEFESFYIRFVERYRTSADHIGFLHHLSAQVLSELMQLGMGVAISKEHTPADIRVRFDEMVTVILAALAWSFASSTDGWVPNEDWNDKPEELRSVIFSIFKEDRSDNNDK